MAVLNVPYIDFFMLTSVDEHLERIDFHRELWQQALPRLFSFFWKLYCPRNILETFVETTACQRNYHGDY